MCSLTVVCSSAALGDAAGKGGGGRNMEEKQEKPTPSDAEKTAALN